jgi:hypothetical protein
VLVRHAASGVSRRLISVVGILHHGAHAVVLFMTNIPTRLLSWKDYWLQQRQQEEQEDDSTSERSFLILLPASRASTVAQVIENQLMRRRTRKGSSSIVVFIPLEDLRARSFELPPRNVGFSVILLSSDTEDWETDDLCSLPQQNADALAFLMPSTGQQQQIQQKPWNVMDVILWSPLDVEDDDETSGDHHDVVVRETDTTSPSLISATPSPLLLNDRLWQPDSMVQEVLLPLLRERLQAHHRQQQLMQEERRRTANDDNSNKLQQNHALFEIWDVGAGSGRDVCFLAEQLTATLDDSQLPGAVVRVVAIDQRYRTPEATRPVQDFFQRRQVTQATDCRQLDLSKSTDIASVVQQIAAKSSVVHCLYAVRYWNKALLQQLMDALENEDDDDNEQNDNDNESNRSGSLLIAISQFGKASVDATWEFDHPKESHVLDRHELAQMFAGHASWTILHDQVVTDSDHGRTLIQFVAERKRRRHGCLGHR